MIYEVELRTVSGDRIPFTEYHYFYSHERALEFVNNANTCERKSAHLTQAIDFAVYTDVDT